MDLFISKLFTARPLSLKRPVSSLMCIVWNKRNNLMGVTFFSSVKASHFYVKYCFTLFSKVCPHWSWGFLSLHYYLLFFLWFINILRGPFQRPALDVFSSFCSSGFIQFIVLGCVQINWPHWPVISGSQPVHFYWEPPSNNCVLGWTTYCNAVLTLQCI